MVGSGGDGATGRMTCRRIDNEGIDSNFALKVRIDS